MPGQLTLAEKIAIHIRELGYYPASVGGSAVSSSSCAGAKEVGVLWDNPDAPPRVYLWGLITVPALCQFVAIVWLDNPNRGASSQRIVVGYYGKENILLASKLANSLAVKFGVGVGVLLEGSEVRTETLNWPSLNRWGSF